MDTAKEETRKVLEHPLYAAMSDASETECTFARLVFKIRRDTDVGPCRILDILSEEERSR